MRCSCTARQAWARPAWSEPCVTRRPTTGVAVLWGRCVRFGAVDAPYVPLIGALEGWVESAEPHERCPMCSMRSPPRASCCRRWAATPPTMRVRLLSVVDALVMAIASHRPTVLVVDDVQWADLASRDALAYLVAGFRSQRLAVLTTYRDEELGTGHPMHSWLADLRRLPSVTDVRLDRLSRDGDRATARRCCWAVALTTHLVDEVVRRSDGNPYLSELLVQGVTRTDDELPADLPAELTGALLAAWHRLSAPAREVMRVLAVAGRPTSIDDLREVAAARGIGPGGADRRVGRGNERRDLRGAGSRPVLVPPSAARRGPVRDLRPRRGGIRFTPPGRRRSSPVPPPASTRCGGRATWPCTTSARTTWTHAWRRRCGQLISRRRIRAPREEAIHLRRAARLWPKVHRGDADCGGR